MSAIEFHCVFCGEKMSVEPALAGAVVGCASCARSVPVPGFPAGGRKDDCLPVFDAGILSLDLNFLCRICRTQLVIDARWEGRSVNCPVCQARQTVPRWSRRALPEPQGQRSPALSEEEIQFLSADPEIQFG